MKLDTVMGRLAANYTRALKQPYVIKPMSYALYHTWQWCNEYEKPRETGKETGHGE